MSGGPYSRRAARRRVLLAGCALLLLGAFAYGGSEHRIGVAVLAAVVVAVALFDGAHAMRRDR